MNKNLIVLTSLVMLSTFAYTSILKAISNPFSSSEKEKTSLSALDQSENEEDLRITQQLRRSLLEDKDLSLLAKNVTIITIDGNITLKGRVSNEQEKTSIAQKALEIRGVKNLDNQLEAKSLSEAVVKEGKEIVKEGKEMVNSAISYGKEKLSAISEAVTSDQNEEQENKDLEKKICQALRSDRQLAKFGDTITIKASNGRVTLKGVVHTEDEKALIANKTLQFKEVKTLDNQLEVKSSSYR